MFESLKKKLKSFLGIEETKKPKKEKKAKTKLKEKKSKQKKVKAEKVSKAKKIKQQTKTSQAIQVQEIKEIQPPIQETIQKIKEEEIEEEKPKETGFFSRLVSKFTGTKITQEHFDQIFMELELTLLENNVALEVVDKIRENLSQSLIGMEIKKSEIESKIIQSLKDSILEVLIEPNDLIEEIKSSKGIYTIIFFGINGSGKTTSLAKLAHKLKKEKISCVLAAADTFRAASIEQLETHANKLGIPLIKHDYGSDPTAVAFDAKKYAEKNNLKCLLIDTAGRMYTKENLIKQMEKIIRVIQPNKKIFVGESITGNDATEQAKTFNEAVGIDGIILSKADVDDKAGTILSVSYVTKKPILFLGVGQSYDDLQLFTKKEVLKNIGLE